MKHFGGQDQVSQTTSSLVQRRYFPNLDLISFYGNRRGLDQIAVQLSPVTNNYAPLSLSPALLSTTAQGLLRLSNFQPGFLPQDTVAGRRLDSSSLR